MRTFPLQTIFFNLFASAIIFFSKSTFLQTIFFLHFFFTMLSSLVLKIFQLFFGKKKSLIPREDPLLLIL